MKRFSKGDRSRRAENERVRRARQKTRKEALLQATDPPLPPLTPQKAHVLALLLTSGLPPPRAVLYLLPGYPDVTLAKAIDAWMPSRVLLKAVTSLNRGEWHLLDKDDRLALALDKSLAEMAYYLYTTRFDAVEGLALRKYETARDTIMNVVKGQPGDRGDALDAFNRFLADVAAGRAKLDAPPQLVPTAIPVLKES